MGTHGLIGFVVDGGDKFSYNHWDSYPSGLGLDVLRWLRDDAMNTLDTTREQARALRVVQDGERPTAEDVERLAPWTDLSVSDRSADDWYCLLRGTQGNPDAILRAGVTEDGLRCGGIEWSYVVDLDEAPAWTSRYADNGGYPTSDEIREHFASAQHRSGGCGLVCTFGEW